MPIISNIAVDFTIEEKNNRINITTAAPTIAPNNILIYEERDSPIIPPIASITTATPKLEPVDTPKIDGPASGLSKVVCNNSPATARAAPARVAVKAIGKRVSTTMVFHVDFETSPPKIAFTTSPKGISIEPNTKFKGNSTTTSNDRAMSVIVERCVVAFILRNIQFFLEIIVLIYSFLHISLMQMLILSLSLQTNTIYNEH